MGPFSRDRYRERLTWIRAGILAANDGIVTITALSLGVAAAKPAEVFVVVTAALIAGSSSMAVGEYMSLSMLADAEHDSGRARTGSPWLAASASASSFLCGGAVPAIATVLAPPHLRLVIVLAAVLPVLMLCGYLGARLAGVPAVKQIRRLLAGGTLAVAVTVITTWAVT